MKLRVEVLLFISVSIFLAYRSLFASDQEMRISDADEEWTASVGQINQEVIDSSEGPVKLPNEALVCRADEVWSEEFGGKG